MSDRRGSAARSLTPIVVAAAMAATLVSAQAPAPAPAEDPYLWLEEVTGEKALAWAKERNAQSVGLLESQPGFKALHERLLAIYNSRERIPAVEKLGSHLYNFWQDEKNPRGIWRRATLAEFRKAEPAWETVLDLGKLSADEKETWVWKGADCLFPEFRRCLLSLSRGGKDAVVLREFDTQDKAFVKGGFEVPEAKQQAAWRNADLVYIASDFGPGTLTKAGYPRVLKRWKRGEALAKAETIFTAQESDVGVWPQVRQERGQRYERFTRLIDLPLEREEYLHSDRRWIKLDVPRDAEVEIGSGLILVRPRTDWTPAKTAIRGGSLAAIELERYVAGSREFEVVFAPAARVSLQSVTIMKSVVLLDLLDNVKSRIVEARREAGAWKLRDVAVPAAAAIEVSAFDHDAGDAYWMKATSFLDPTTLYLARAGDDARERMKSLPAFFDAKGLKVEQFEASARDGTKIPYFAVMREGTKLDGSNPTILYGYGGFEVPMTPNYSGTIGSAWLEQGGVWVLSNIRGGGEFGPEWHRVARRAGKQTTHDDFIAVAEDLIRRGISSPRHLGVMGGSQGGLLVGAAFTQRPELFRAVVSAVPLADMKRYHKLLAGNSWMGEYGNPDDPKDWAYLSKYSPYQNLAKGKKYPKVFFTTSTRDDRVHPAHARKMVARMMEQGHEVLYFEYLEGGHASGANPTQQAYTWALTYTFFQKELR